jgi:hypothetical protein
VTAETIATSICRGPQWVKSSPSLFNIAKLEAEGSADISGYIARAIPHMDSLGKRSYTQSQAASVLRTSAWRLIKHSSCQEWTSKLGKIRTTNPPCN